MGCQTSKFDKQIEQANQKILKITSQESQKQMKKLKLKCPSVSDFSLIIDTTIGGDSSQSVVKTTKNGGLKDSIPSLFSPRKNSFQVISRCGSNKDNEESIKDVVDIDDDFAPSQILSDDQDIKEILSFLKNTYKPQLGLKDLSDEQKLQILEQKNNELDLQLKIEEDVMVSEFNFQAIENNMNDSRINDFDF